MSQTGRYKKPSFDFETYDWFGDDERIERPLNRLSRSMYEITVNATDVYEIAAHLEAIGYNSYRVKREFGYDSPFELAKAIKELTPKKPIAEHSWQKSLNSMWLRQLSILLAILATIILQIKTIPHNWLTIVWLIIWSVIGAKLINKMSAELSTQNSRRVLTVNIVWGFLGLVLVWGLKYPSLPEAIINTLWWGLTSLLWIETVSRKASYKSFVLVAIAFLGIFNLPLIPIIILLNITTIYIIIPDMRLPKLDTWTWLISSTKSVALIIPYGLGIGLLLVELFQAHSKYTLIAGSILVIMSFASEWLVIWLKDRLSSSLWIAKSDKEYASRTSIVSWTIFFLLVGAALVILLFSLLSSDGNLILTVAHFILYGLVLSFALILLTLDSVWLLSLSFALVLVLMFVGVSLSFILILTPAVLATAIFFALQKTEEYGIHVV